VSRPSLSGLSDRELLSRVKALVQKERATTIEILVHLSEVEKRQLHVVLGYPSLFEYCTRYLGYSSSAAGRRIHAARCVRDFPEAYGLLESNEVTLITVSLVASILTDANKHDILGQIRRKSQREVEAIVATYRPPVAFRDRAKPVCVAVAVPKEVMRANSGQICPITPSAGSELSPNVVASSPVSANDALPCPAPPRLERKLLVQFLASEAFMKKFEEARALLSNKNGGASYEAVLEAALSEFLARRSHKNKKQRRETRKLARKHHESAKKPVASREERSRYVPETVRDEVFTRDKSRCTFRGPTGERCSSTHGPQIDHIVPFGRGGTNTASNLRLLCAKHNRLEAERIYGASAIRRFHTRE